MVEDDRPTLTLIEKILVAANYRVTGVMDGIAALNSAQVRYLIVGGYSVVYHGYPRYTGDIDIFVAISPRNAVALAKVTAEAFPLTTLQL